MRIIRSASAPLPADLIRELESLFGVPMIETYGMTEAASQIAANPLQRRKPGSVGRPTGAEIIIMDGEGRRLTAGEAGEIALRGPTIARGYDNDRAATEAAFRDGWFRTGDLGYLDEDGYLFIVGRSKDVIKRGGQHLCPPRWKRFCLDHPGVVDAAAFSIPHPRLGEDVAAAVVLAKTPRSAPKTCATLRGNGWPITKCRASSGLCRRLQKAPGARCSEMSSPPHFQRRCQRTMRIVATHSDRPALT